MLLTGDYQELGFIDETLMEPVKTALEETDWTRQEFERHEVTLLGGKLLVLPFLIFKPEQIKYTEEQQRVYDTIKPIVEEVMKQFPGYVKVRGELATLLPNVKIKLHYDDRWFHEHCRRIHVPIITNDKCQQIFEDRIYHLDYSKIYEINNRGLHSAANYGDAPRVHLIIDILEETTYNSIGRSLDKLNEIRTPERFQKK